MVWIGYFFVFLCIDAFVVQRNFNESHTSEIQSIETKSPKYSAEEIADELIERIKDEFYENNLGNWQNNCQDGGVPVLWQVAVAGHAIRRGDKEMVSIALSSILNYRSSSGGYSATTAKNGEIYTDDDAQVQWCFMDAYSLEKNDTILEEAKNLTDFILSYQYKDDGVLWSITGDYIALISSLESALSSLRFYEVSGESKYLNVAKQSINWVLDTLVDDNDGFIMDGETIKGDINGGKLTYTIGTLISSLAYLTKLGDKDKDWKAMAIEFGLRLTASGKLNNQFFTDGYINDIIERSHLAYVGLADLLTMTDASDNYEKDVFDLFKQFVVREARHNRDKYNSTITTDTCPQDDFQHLLKFGSLIQVFLAASRVSTMI